jgi:Holliday junction resolvase RusA-like endonuclease
MIKLNLPFPPSVNSIWKHRKGGGVYLDPKYRAWKREADGCFMQQRKTCGPSITGKFNAILWFDESRRRSNTDLDNRIKVCLDAVQRFGLVVNDSHLDKLDAQWMPVEGVFIALDDAP